MHARRPLLSSLLVLALGLGLSASAAADAYFPAWEDEQYADDQQQVEYGEPDDYATYESQYVADEGVAADDNPGYYGYEDNQYSEGGLLPLPGRGGRYHDAYADYPVGPRCR